MEKKEYYLQRTLNQKPLIFTYQQETTVFAKRQLFSILEIGNPSPFSSLDDSELSFFD